MIKSRRMRWAGHIECMENTWFLWRSLRERDNLENISIDGRIILRWIFKQWDGETWNGLIWFRIGHL